MCYQESRWHAICNHTIQSRVECPKHCLRYGAVDTVETQLTAYCHACRRHVDSLGVAAQYRNSANRLSSRRSKPVHLPLASSSSMENIRASAGSPTPSMRSIDRLSSMKTVSGSSLSKRLTSASSTGDLRGDMTPRGQASMGRIMSVFMQEQRDQEQERVEDERLSMEMIGAVPELRSPIPQKPLLSVRIPEEAVSHVALSPTPPTADSTTSDGFPPSQVTLSPETDFKSPKLGSSERASSTAATTPVKTPSRSSLSASLEDRPSKPPSDPLPSLPLPAQPSKHSTFGFTLHELRKGLRKTKSSSRLLGSRPPYLIPRKNSPVEPMPSPPLRRTKSSRTLGSDSSSNTTVGSLRPDRDWSGVPPSSSSSPPPGMPKSRPGGSERVPFKPVLRKDVIDIHDPEWLIKHGLKWDAHGLGVVSANV